MASRLGCVVVLILGLLPAVTRAQPSPANQAVAALDDYVNALSGAVVDIGPQPFGPYLLVGVGSCDGNMPPGVPFIATRRGDWSDTRAGFDLLLFKNTILEDLGQFRQQNSQFCPAAAPTFQLSRQITEWSGLIEGGVAVLQAIDRGQPNPGGEQSAWNTMAVIMRDPAQMIDDLNKVWAGYADQLNGPRQLTAAPVATYIKDQIRNNSSGLYPYCDHGDVESAINTVRGQTDQLMAVLNTSLGRLSQAADAAQRAAGLFLGVLQNIRLRFAQAQTQLDQARQTPAGAARSVRLGAFLYTWRGLDSYLKQQLDARPGSLYCQSGAPAPQPPAPQQSQILQFPASPNNQYHGHW